MSSVNETRLKAGTKIKVLSISSSDPSEAIGVVGSIGEITHPFGDSPDTVAGVWVETRGNVPFGVKFTSNRISLVVGDRIKVLSTGKTVTLRKETQTGGMYLEPQE